MIHFVIHLKYLLFKTMKGLPAAEKLLQLLLVEESLAFAVDVVKIILEARSLAGPVLRIADGVYPTEEASVLHQHSANILNDPFRIVPGKVVNFVVVPPIAHLAQTIKLLLSFYGMNSRVSLKFR